MQINTNSKIARSHSQPTFEEVLRNMNSSIELLSHRVAQVERDRPVMRLSNRRDKSLRWVQSSAIAGAVVALCFAAFIDTEQDPHRSLKFAVGWAFVAIAATVVRKGDR